MVSMHVWLDEQIMKNSRASDDAAIVEWGEGFHVENHCLVERPEEVCPLFWNLKAMAVH